MNESYKIVLDTHKKKLELLISRYEQLMAVNRELKENLERRDAEIKDCREKLNESNNKIKELEQRIDKLQIARQNIGRLVREIDKCISLLND